MTALRASLARLRRRGGRVLLAALGILAASLMLGTAATLAYGLATGFERAAERADLPDVIARFERQQVSDVDARISALPNVEAQAYRLEDREWEVEANGNRSERAVMQIARGERRGYAIVEGRDVRGAPGEVVVERGVAREWGLEVGDTATFFDQFPLTVVGFASAPDNVSFPLSPTPRFFISYEGVRAALGDAPFLEEANVALIWAEDPSQLDVLLTQARATSFGIENLRFLTREGVLLLVDEAAGIVIALLVAFSLVALAAAGIMLGASARAEVQRRLESIGVLRALGFTRATVTRAHALDAAVVALPAGLLGLAVGALVASGPSARLLESLNGAPPGAALLGPLALCLVAVVVVVVLASAWPAWRAASRPPAQAMGGAGLTPPRAGRRSRLPGGGLGLGMRLVAARPALTAATVAVLAAATAVVLLMLALASFLVRLQEDPATLSKRFQLQADAGPSDVEAIRGVAGVDDASPRYVVEALDSFRLGEQFRLIAMPGDHTPFEAPPLAEGRRVRGPGEVEIGVGLSDALGLPVGGTLPALLPSGDEVRFRVVGIVRALEKDGRTAYVQPDRLLEADPFLDPLVAVRLEPGAELDAVARGLREIGIRPAAVAAGTSANAQFLGILAAVLRVAALVNGLICLYALVQSLALTALERRQAIAVLRAGGAGRREVALVFLGAGALVVGLAAPLGVLLERLVLAPAASRLAADYASVPLGAGVGSIAAVVVALGLLAWLASAWVTRRVEREPVVLALREA